MMNLSKLVRISLLLILGLFNPNTPKTNASNWLGLYTSPHLVAVRERIRINGVPLSEDRFAKYFFEVWDQLEANPAVRLSPFFN